jgi:hypothetical protein
MFKIARTYHHSPLIEVETVWVVTPWNYVVGNQRFEDRAASIFRVEVHVHGDLSTAV